MQLRKTISFITALVLVTMMVCPAIGAVQKSTSKTDSHCHGETLPKQELSRNCCCDQSAISVQEQRAPFESPALHLLVPLEKGAGRIVFPLDLDYSPYSKTGDHLAKLSTLRL